MTMFNTSQEGGVGGGGVGGGGGGGGWRVQADRLFRIFNVQQA